MKGPLENIRVLDFSEIIAGPFAGMLLSDMGADVIKIEPPWENLGDFLNQLFQMKAEHILV